VSLLQLLAPIGAVVGPIGVARWIAGAAFVALLAALLFGLMRTRKQLRYDEADAALEADFLRLERQFPADIAAPAPAPPHGGEG
jgi:hypothetical protein